jgi:hypothetical protein
MLGRSLAFALAVSLSALACGSSSGTTAKLGGLPRPAPLAVGDSAAVGQRALAAHRFAEVSDVIGPYVGRDGDAALAAWAEAGESGHDLLAVAIDVAGLPGKPVRLGSIAPELDLVLVRGFGAASARLPGRPRFAIVTSRRAGQSTHVEVTATDESGAPLFGPASVAERAARVLWVGFVVTGRAPLVLWAEQAASAKVGEPATLMALPLSLETAPVAPVVVAAKACVWQVASLLGQAALATVKATNNACGVGSVALDLLGPSGKPDKSLALGGRAALDLDMVAGPDAFVLAWSEQSELEPRVFSAVVEPSGAVRSAKGAAVTALGEQAVVALTSGASTENPAFLVWESVAERHSSTRSFEVSALDAKGRASGPRSRISYERAGGGAPELVPFAGGVAALTLAPACEVAESCEGNPPVPTFVALDQSLAVTSSEPLMLAPLGGRAAELGWGLTCGERGCFALSALSASPAALFTVPLPVRAGRYRAAAERTPPQARPRVVSSDVLLRAPGELAQLASARAPGRDVVGYVTDFDPSAPWQRLTKPAEDGRFEPLRARIGFRSFEGSGARAALSDEQVLSLRAHSLGGLSLLPDSAAPKGLLALWAGLDNGQAQVFATLLGADGKRGQQRMLTRSSGGASDVAGLAVDGGYLIGWVDERSGDAEVYAARVGRALEKASPEQRITSVDGAASDLSLTFVGGKPYAVWSDARGAAEPGWADIFGAFLRPRDAAREGDELRLSSTRPHSFAPKIDALGGVPVLAWLEDADGVSPASVRLATLAPSGEVQGGVSVVPIDVGVPRGLGLHCVEAACRVAFTLEVEGGAELYGFEWKPGAEPRPARLSALSTATAAAVAPLVQGDVVYVGDARDGKGLVRRLGVEW